MKMRMLSKFFAVVIYIKTYDQKTSHTFFWPFLKKLLQSMTTITKLDVTALKEIP